MNKNTNENFICPKCKKKIEYANFSAEVESFGNVEIAGGEYDTRDYGSWGNVVYSCPLCDKVITKEIEKVL